MKKFYYTILSFSFVLIYTACLAQDTVNTGPPEMATGLRSSGKIYVVVAVLLTILAGIVFYLVQLDRKIKKLEKNSVPGNGNRDLHR